MEEIYKKIYEKDYNAVKSIITQMSHTNYIKVAYQLSYIGNLFEKSNKIFMKLFKIINNKPEFYTYGYLYKNCFKFDKSDVNVFSYNNLNKRISIRKDNNCYLILVGDSVNYLLYNPYSNIVANMLNKIVAL